MNNKPKKLRIPSFDDTTVIGINSVMPDYKLAWSINDKLSIELMKFDDLEVEGANYSFFYFTAGENYNVYNLVSLVRNEKVLYPFKPRLDYLFLIQNSITAERRLNLVTSIREITGVGHAFLLEKDKDMRQVLEIIGDCEQRSLNKKKKLNDINEVRKRLREEEVQKKVFWENQK